MGLALLGDKLPARAGGAVGAHLAMRRRRGAAGRRPTSCSRTSRRRRRAGSRRSRRRCRRPPATRCRRSSISSATCSASWATATTIAKASPRSSPSGRRASPAADGSRDGRRAARRTPPSPSSAPARWAPASRRSPRCAAIASSCTTRASAPATRRRRGIAETLDKLVAKGRLARADADAARRRGSRPSCTLPDVCVAQLVVEAIVEDLAAKRELLRARSRTSSTPDVHPRVEHVVAVDHRARRPA